MNHDFRNSARECVKSARDHLSVTPPRAREAALALRMAMEYLTYHRLEAYPGEISDFETWQPKKVMEMLLQIDPHADKDSVIRFGLEETPGEAATEMKTLGAEKVLNLRTIKKYYDALGSFLHAPTLGQLRSGRAPSQETMVKKCNEIAAEIEATLASKIWNAKFGKFAAFKCERCGHQVRKRLVQNEPVQVAICMECHASYDVMPDDANGFTWLPRSHSVACQTNQCDGQVTFWEDEIEPGKELVCNLCGMAHRVVLAIGVDTKSVDDSTPHNGQP